MLSFHQSCRVETRRGGNRGTVLVVERWQRSWKGPFRNAPCTALARYGMVKDPAAQRIRPTPNPTEAQPGIRPMYFIPRPAAPCGMKLLGFWSIIDRSARGFTPLCPAGHLPLKGGDRSAARFRPSQQSRMKWRKGLWPISPLEGEMPGRAEGGKPHPRSTSLKSPPSYESVRFLRYRLTQAFVALHSSGQGKRGNHSPSSKWHHDHFATTPCRMRHPVFKCILFRGFSCTSSI